MRTRNIKINIFLNEEEKKMLIDKSNKVHLSQSDFFRLLNSDNGLINYDTDEIINVLTNVSNNLSKLSNQLNRLIIIL